MKFLNIALRCVVSLDVGEVVLDLLGREPLEAVGVAHSDLHVVLCHLAGNSVVGSPKTRYFTTTGGQLSHIKSSF